MPSPDDAAGSLDQFDFELPEELIALRPARPRDAARLLVVNREAPGSIEDRTVADLPSLLRPGDVLVANNTKVLKARLRGTRARGEAVAQVELLLHKPEAEPNCWRAFARPAKRLKPGDVVTLTGGTQVQVIAREDAEAVVRFGDGGLQAAMDAAGEMPLPPYIAGRRAADAQDVADYQTLFAREEGSVAAPTAGLHFTPGLLDALAEAGVSRETVTLHVGAGTFLPVKAENLDAHTMHSEWGEVTEETAQHLNAARQAGNRIVAVGTTSARLLESAADDNRRFHAFRGETDIFIRPGHRFRAVDVLMTNFHLPRSTLFVLVSAFAGLATMKAAYAHAIAERYRFYSYGDASLLFPERAA